ncbi:MAG TPA: ParA family protein [Chloroflexota bacterium]|nr:ParA family protein [Chloroflexota bacterium]
MERARIIAIANRKGGVGKTMTALHLAGVLADRGVRVLLGDLDAQASLTRILTPSLASPGIGTCLLDPSFPASKCVISTAAGLDLLPGDMSIMRADRALQDTPGQFNRLARVLRPLTGYDLLLLDTPPALNFALQSSLIAAGWALLPTMATQHDLDALVDTLGLLEQLEQDEVPHAAPLAIVPNGIKRDTVDEAGISVLRHTYGDLVSDPIPYAVAIKKAINAHLPLSQWDARAPVLTAYRRLADRITERLALGSEPRERVRARA